METPSSEERPGVDRVELPPTERDGDEPDYDAMEARADEATAEAEAAARTVSELKVDGNAVELTDEEKARREKSTGAIEEKTGWFRRHFPKKEKVFNEGPDFKIDAPVVAGEFTATEKEFFGKTNEVSAANAEEVENIGQEEKPAEIMATSGLTGNETQVRRKLEALYEEFARRRDESSAEADERHPLSKKEAAALLSLVKKGDEKKLSKSKRATLGKMSEQEDFSAAEYNQMKTGEIPWKMNAVWQALQELNSSKLTWPNQEEGKRSTSGTIDTTTKAALGAAAIGGGAAAIHSLGKTAETGAYNEYELSVNADPTIERNLKELMTSYEQELAKTDAPKEEIMQTMRDNLAAYKNNFVEAVCKNLPPNEAAEVRRATISPIEQQKFIVTLELALGDAETSYVAESEAMIAGIKKELSEYQTMLSQLNDDVDIFNSISNDPTKRPAELMNNLAMLVEYDQSYSIGLSPAEYQDKLLEQLAAIPDEAQKTEFLEEKFKSARRAIDQLEDTVKTDIAYREESIAKQEALLAAEKTKMIRPPEGAATSGDEYDSIEIDGGGAEPTPTTSSPDAGADDEHLLEAVEYVKDRAEISAKGIQKRYGIGHDRAAKIITRLEEMGLIGPQDGTNPRLVLGKKPTSIPKPALATPDSAKPVTTIEKRTPDEIMKTAADYLLQAQAKTFNNIDSISLDDLEQKLRAVKAINNPKQIREQLKADPELFGLKKEDDIDALSDNQATNFRKRLEQFIEAQIQFKKDRLAKKTTEPKTPDVIRKTPAELLREIEAALHEKQNREMGNISPVDLRVLEARAKAIQALPDNAKQARETISANPEVFGLDPNFDLATFDDKQLGVIVDRIENYTQALIDRKNAEIIKTTPKAKPAASAPVTAPKPPDVVAAVLPPVTTEPKPPIIVSAPLTPPAAKKPVEVKIVSPEEKSAAENLKKRVKKLSDINRELDTNISDAEKKTMSDENYRLIVIAYEEYQAEKQKRPLAKLELIKRYKAEIQKLLKPTELPKAPTAPEKPVAASVETNEAPPPPSEFATKKLPDAWLDYATADDGIHKNDPVFLEQCLKKHLGDALERVIIFDRENIAIAVIVGPDKKREALGIPIFDSYSTVVKNFGDKKHYRYGKITRVSRAAIFKPESIDSALGPELITLGSIIQ